MVTVNTGEKCKLTGLEKLNVAAGEKGYYNVNIDGTELEIRFCKNCYDNENIVKHKDVILSLLVNDRVYKTGREVLHWEEKKYDDGESIYLKSLVLTGVYPRTPKEKLEHLFKGLFELQQYEGQVIPTITGFFTRKNALSYYFKHIGELKHYMRALAKQGDIDIAYNSEADTISQFRVTYQGLNTHIQLFETGYNSKSCFIAMSFSNDEQTRSIRKHIKEAISDTNYQPVIIDEEHVGSDKTIIDEMIHKLRSCKFCIADFTGQKGGVYFESGFALGQGKPVIYTCHADDFPNVHFDIKQLQHIIYKTPEELKEALKHKIKAWIL